MIFIASQIKIQIQTDHIMNITELVLLPKTGYIPHSMCVDFACLSIYIIY